MLMVCMHVLFLPVDASLLCLGLYVDTGCEETLEKEKHYATKVFRQEKLGEHSCLPVLATV